MATDLHHEFSGRPDPAETVLLSSGLGGAAGYWKPQLAAFGESFRVLTYDQRGTGRSPEALGPDHDIAAMAADALGVMDRAGIARCHFVGHALGGLIGLQLARSAPERLSSLTVVNGWARLDSHTARCFAVRIALLRDTGVAAFVQAQPIFLYPAAYLSANAAWAEAEDAHGVAHFQGAGNWLQRVAAASAFDIAGDPPRLHTRTLFLAARDDVLVPFAMSQALAQAMPASRLVLLDGGGHAVNVTEPARFNACLLEFLSGA